MALHREDLDHDDEKTTICGGASECGIAWRMCEGRQRTVRVELPSHRYRPDRHQQGGVECLDTVDSDVSEHAHGVGELGYSAILLRECMRDTDQCNNQYRDLCGAIVCSLEPGFHHCGHIADSRPVS